MYNSKYETMLFYHRCQKWLNTVLETSKTMYHYTSVDVLKSIIEGKCLYATHINFMNDWEEYRLGYRMLTEQIKETIEKYRSDFETVIGADNLEQILKYFKEECLNVTTYHQLQETHKFKEFLSMTIPEVYAVSFCKEKDLLSQWAIYAKESGVAIEFDFTDFVFCDAALGEEEEKKYSKKYWQEIKYYRYNQPHVINYSNQDMVDKLREQIVEVVRMIKNPSFVKNGEFDPVSTLLRKITALFNIVPYCKLDKFKAENEVRLAFNRIENWIYDEEERNGTEYKTKVFYRTANHVLKPYVKIGWEAQKESCYPIKKIIIGPGENQEAVFRGVIHFIENQSLDVIPDVAGKKSYGEPMVDESYLTCKGIKIEKSNIPYIFK